MGSGAHGRRSERAPRSEATGRDRMPRMRDPVPARLARARDALARTAPVVLILAGVLRAASTLALGSPADSPRSPEQAAQAASSAVAETPPPPAAGTVLYRIDPN